MFPSLVVFSFRERFPLQDCFQYLGVKFSHLKDCSCDRNNLHQFTEQEYLHFQFMEVCRCEPLRVSFLYPFFPVVKPRGTVPFPFPPCPAVLLPVIVGFRLHLRQVPLFTQQFLLFRAYTDPNVLGTGIGLVFYFLYLPVLTVQQLDREVWAVPVYDGTSLFQEFACPVLTGRHHGLPSVSYYCYHKFPFRLTPPVRHPYSVRMQPFRCLCPAASLIYKCSPSLMLYRVSWQPHFPIPIRECLTAARRAGDVEKIPGGLCIPV